MFGFLGLIPTGWKFAIGATLITAVIAGGGYLFIQWQDAKIEKLEQELTTTRNALETTRETMQTMRKNYQILRENQERLGERFNEIDRETQQLEKLFSEHDLGNLAEQKPGLIENRVNSGTRDVLQDFENLTDPKSFKVNGNENN